MDFTNGGTDAEAMSVFTQKFLPTDRLCPAIKSGKGSYFFSSTTINGATYRIDDDIKTSGWCPKSGEQLSFIGVSTQNPETFYALDIKMLTGSRLTKFYL
jgi:hypothetical protein